MCLKMVFNWKWDEKNVKLMAASRWQFGDRLIDCTTAKNEVQTTVTSIKVARMVLLCSRRTETSPRRYLSISISLCFLHNVHQQRTKKKQFGCLIHTNNWVTENWHEKPINKMPFYNSIISCVKFSSELLFSIFHLA